jgi:hypothetical protein
MTKGITHHSNDNERDSFSAIGLAALLIVNRLRNENQLVEIREEQQEHRQWDGHSDGANQCNGAGNDQKSPNRIGNRG